jgi:hypothetical protein
MRGSSVAAAYVSAAAALLFGLVPDADPERIRAMLLGRTQAWRSIVPPALDLRTLTRTLR